MNRELLNVNRLKLTNPLLCFCVRVSSLETYHEFLLPKSHAKNFVARDFLDLTA